MCIKSTKRGERNGYRKNQREDKGFAVNGADKKRLTTEELVTLLLTDVPSDEPVTEEDVELIAQVLGKVSEKKCSVRHAQFLMDTCRKLILAIATFQV